MKRHEIINWFIDKNGYASYLEIGVDNPNNCFNLVNAELKVGVDPIKGGTHKMTSDHFFAVNKNTFDIIFVDGMHTKEQAKKDIVNSLKCLAPGGRVVVHDLFPKSEAEQTVPRRQSVWTGDVWKAWAELRAKRTALTMYTLNTDHGVGVIRKGRQSLYRGPYETYVDFIENMTAILNLKEVSDIE